jgi:hypothetical protein
VELRSPGVEESVAAGSLEQTGGKLTPTGGKLRADPVSFEPHPVELR